MVLALMRGAARLLRSVPRRLRGRESVFTRIYATNEWGSAESVSGFGSTLRETRVVRQVLPALVARYGVQTLLDIPCGDCHWMREIDFGGGPRHRGAIQTRMRAIRAPGSRWR